MYKLCNDQTITLTWQISLIIIDEMLYKSDKSNCRLFPLFSFDRIFFNKKNPFVQSLFDPIPSFLANRRNHEARSSFDSDWEHISRVLCYLDARHLYQERMILSTLDDWIKPSSWERLGQSWKARGSSIMHSTLTQCI